MRVNFYILSRFIISRKKFLNAFFFVFLASLLWGQSPFVDNAPGSRSWTAPAGVTSITVEVWGAGGGGQGVGVNGTSQSGGGGAGGGYVKTTYSVTPGIEYNYKVGSGGSGGETNKDGEASWFESADTILAVGGKGAGSNTIQGNGTGAISIKSGNIGGALISTYGGNGADGTNGISGGGGSSAGDTNGNNALGGYGGVAPNNGFSGADGLTKNPSNGVDGNIGAGGSGAKKGSGSAVRTGGSGGSGQIRITYTLSCSGTPTGGTSNLSATTGVPNSTFTASVTGSVTGSAYTYQWQSAPSSTGPWTDIAGATSSGATTITAVSTVSTTYYRRRVTCTNSGLVDYSSTVSYTTVLTYCKPTSSSPSSLYIREFQFVGTLNNVPANTSTYATGYQDFTYLTPAQQPQNAAMNITAKTNGTSGGSWKAWVDWNRDGDFSDAGEEIYRMTGWTTPSITFGFIIPPTALGVYRLRIGTKSSASNFGNCDNFNGGGQDPIYGEYEDYLFEAVVDCSAKVITINDVNAFDGERCGAGSVKLSATGNASAVSFRWYANETGGTPLPNANASSANFDTPFITPTDPSKSYYATYYVTAVSSDGCETAYRYPVVARIDPQPTVTFSTDKPAICGEDDPTLLVTAAGDKYQDVIFEKFDSGLGVFNNIVAGTYTNPLGDWMNKPSPYIPKVAEGYAGTSPAFSSGYFGGNYAIINSDISRTTNVLNYMVSNDLDVSGYINLKLDFDMYHFSIAANDTQGYVKVEYSLDSGANWNALTTFFNDVGNPFNWYKFTFDIPGSNFTSSKFKIRFTHFSAAASGVFYEAITTVDNVRLYGYKNITTPFAWSSATTTLYKSDCVTALGSALESTVCVKPTATELEDVNWALNASATFSNGCPAIGNYTVSNDTKTWLQPGITDWNLGAQWKPSTVPTIAKCVIVRTPVELPSLTTGTHGLARSVIVKPGGKLTVEPKSSLTIQNYLKNEAAASDVLVESDANLLQINNSSVNIGNITVKRNANLKRLDYTYWGSPVIGQNVKAFSAGTLDTRFYVYNESNDYFDGLFIRNLYPDNVTYSQTPTVDKNTHTFIRGKGYAVRASNALSNVLSSIPHSFVGVPNNGLVDIPVVKSATGQGYNLISNPYPSNIDFYALYNYGTNSSIIYNTAYFWTNTNYNPKMQGANYPSDLPDGTKIINNYAILNGTGGVSAPYASGTGNNNPIGSLTNCPTCTTPNQYIKVGQGFIVKVRNAGSYNLSLENNNGIRNNNSTSVFFNRMANNNQRTNVEKDRFWISLKTPLDFVSPILIGYPQGSTTNYEEDYDAELLIYGGDSFYSNLDNKKLAIQGRGYPFNPSDEVTLGARLGLEGQYEISLGAKEGVFANGQNIYLKDNITGTITNLSEGAYRFVARSGEVNNRFQILYANSTLGSESGQTEKEFIVYQQNHYAMISTAESMKSVKIYDITGKLIFHKKVNKKDFQIDTSSFQSGTYVIEVLTTNRYFTRKIIK